MAAKQISTQMEMFDDGGLKEEGGTIGTGIAPTPGEQGFTGTPQNGQQQQASNQPTETVGEQPQAPEQLQ